MHSSSRCISTLVFCVVSLLLPTLLQRGNLQCGTMDGFRMRLFLVVVICFFFGCFRVVYIPPVILIRRGRMIIPITHCVSRSVRQNLLNNCYPKPRHEPWVSQPGVWVGEKKTKQREATINLFDGCRIRKRTSFLNTRQGPLCHADTT
jgi:hypothetical protein